MLNLEVDIKHATEATAEIVGEALLENIVVVIKDQKNLTPEDQVRFCKMIGEVENYHALEHVKQFTKPIAVNENVRTTEGWKISRRIYHGCAVGADRGPLCGSTIGGCAALY